MMSPHFVDLSNEIKSPYSYKYRFFRYYEGWYDDERTEGCVPVVFVPGSAGNYKQVRSLASEVLSYPFTKHCFKFYTVDFLEEFVAFSARLLRQQAWYVNDSIKYMTELFVHTDSIILVGHSFGGVVLRMIQTLSNYLLQGHATFIITIASPHGQPPLKVSLELDRLYDSLNGKIVNLSIASGSADIQVPSYLSVIRDSQLNTINLRVEKVSRTSSNPNHLAMVWDRTFLSQLAIMFHGIVDKAAFKSDHSIRQFIDQSFNTPEEKYMALETQVVCDMIMKRSITDGLRGFRRKDVCHDNEKLRKCIVVDHMGRFQVSTNEEYPQGLAIYTTFQVSTNGEYPQGLTIYTNASYDLLNDEKTLSLRTPSIIHKCRFPGRGHELPTITGSKTCFTEFTARLTGDSPGIIIFRYDCNVSSLFDHDEADWRYSISNWQESFVSIKESLSTKLVPANNPVQHNIGAFGLLFGANFLVNSTELQLNISSQSPKSVSLSFGSNTNILSIAAYDENRLARYSMVKGLRHELVVEPDTLYLRVYLEELGATRLYITNNYMHTFIMSLTDDPSRLLVELYTSATLIGDLPLWQVLSLLLLRDFFFEFTSGSIGIMLTMMKSVWIGTICYVFMRLLARKPGKVPPDWKWGLVLFLIFLLPISTDLQIIAQLVIILACKRGFTTGTIVLCFSLTPKIVKAVFDIRNLYISVAEMGFYTVLSHEARAKYFASMVSFIPAFEVIVEIVEWRSKKRSSNRTLRTLLPVTWSIVVAIISHKLTTSYFLPIVHFTTLLTRIID